ncbi:LamG-like jellyroll fold domain-containing protein [Catenovulum sediminis]|uniref:LamG-like jellyroll fold domain-containing protein n=2 Tax=Catenovulum sediminis TaxID=1740262 RepID=UPI00163D9C58|nr:LamG-like jellyroll fold domain-containing protein [Catenovulum sediminis]
MQINRLVQVCLLSCALTSMAIGSPSVDSDSECWRLAHFLNITQSNIEIVGSPKKSSDKDSALVFNGINDRLFITKSPVHNYTGFTIEMEVHPYAFSEKNSEPRLLHFESTEDGNKRITMEMRITEDNNWYFDAFLKNGKEGLTLVDPNKLHATERWYNVAITYDGHWFSTWVQGKKELSQSFYFNGLGEHITGSVAARLNKVHWFKGEIGQICYSNRVLSASQFKLQ